MPQLCCVMIFAKKQLRFFFALASFGSFFSKFLQKRHVLLALFTATFGSFKISLNLLGLSIRVVNQEIEWDICPINSIVCSNRLEIAVISSSLLSAEDSFSFSIFSQRCDNGRKTCKLFLVLPLWNFDELMSVVFLIFINSYLM